MPKNRYAGLPTTALSNSTLVEIGRCVAHHGLLVDAVRDFSQLVGQYCTGFPVSISTRECVDLLPVALSAIAPVFGGKEKEALRKALDQVALAEELMDRLRWSYWGVGRGGDFEKAVCSEKIKSAVGDGCVLDQREFSDVDLHQVACDITLGIRYLADVRASLERKLAAEGKELRQKLKAAAG